MTDHLNPQQHILERTLTAYADGFHVEHIATFGLDTCQVDDQAENVFSKFETYDQIPVKDGEILVGVLLRNDPLPRGVVKDVMYPLNDSLLVSSDQPLSEFLPFMKEAPYFRLVVKGTRVAGIVTRSDILKLPVRVYAFAISINLEMAMQRFIVRFISTDEKLKEIYPEKRKILENRKKKDSRINLDMIEFTQLSDKIEILERLLNSRIDPEGFDGIIADLNKINDDYRNPLSHRDKWIPNQDMLIQFIDLLGIAQKWTDFLIAKLDQLEKAA